MNNSKNLMVALALSFVVMILWNFFYVKPKIDEYKKQKQEYEQAQAKKSDTNGSDSLSDINNENKVLLDRKEALNIENRRIKINSPKLHGSISLKGARIDDLTLGQYKQNLDESSPEVELLSPSTSKKPYYVEFGWLGNNIKIPDSNTVWYSDDKVLTPSQPITLSWDNNQGLRFSTTISMDDNYLFTFKRSVENYGNEDITINSYGLVNRFRNLGKKSFYILHEGALGVFGDQLYEETFDSVRKQKRVNFDDVNGWLGITDKYWLTALIPDQNNFVDVKFNYYNKNGLSRFQVDYLSEETKVSAGSSFEITDNLFAGAKKVELLDEYGTKLDIKLFDRSVDFGMLYFLTKPIFKVLNFFYGILGNFGLAILALTVAIKLILFPLVNKSYISMHKMKAIHPKMVQIKEQYKDDRQEAQKQIMSLYKKEGVNPVSGCLPMLLQLPVFFALYKVLFVTIEMRHAPFYGWIYDLSAVDPTNIFNLFGLLPFELPIAISAWSIIMGITMFLQQKLSPPPADPIQAKIMKFLPVIVVIMTATFPAGLLIYWSWSNTLTFIQQLVIKYRYRNLDKKYSN